VNNKIWDSCGLRGIQGPEKYKEKFDVSSESVSSATNFQTKICLYFSGTNCIFKTIYAITLRIQALSLVESHDLLEGRRTELHHT
jgi:hypothetical protein